MQPNPLTAWNQRSPRPTLQSVHDRLRLFRQEYRIQVGVFATALGVRADYLAPSHRRKNAQQIWNALRPRRLKRVANQLHLPIKGLLELDAIWQDLDQVLNGLPEHPGEWTTRPEMIAELAELAADRYFASDLIGADGYLDAAGRAFEPILDQLDTTQLPLAVHTGALLMERLTHRGHASEALRIEQHIRVVLARQPRLNRDLALAWSLALIHSSYARRHAGATGQAIRDAWDAQKLLLKIEGPTWMRSAALGNYAKACAFSALRKDEPSEPTQLAQATQATEEAITVAGEEPTTERDAVECFARRVGYFEILAAAGKEEEAKRRWDAVFEPAWVSSLLQLGIPQVYDAPGKLDS